MTEALPHVADITAGELEFSRLAAFGLRMRVWWARDRLTRALATGASSIDTRALALRAGQITARRTREVVAASIDDILQQANRPAPGLSAQAPVSRAKVRANHAQLAELAARLRATAPVRAQGMALALLLLTDPERPLFGPGDEAELAGAIIDSTHRLDADRDEGWA